MIALTMGSINAVSDEIETKLDKKEAAALTKKVIKTLVPLQKAMQEQKEREQRGARHL